MKFIVRARRIDWVYMERTIEATDLDHAQGAGHRLIDEYGDEGFAVVEVIRSPDDLEYQWVREA